MMLADNSFEVTESTQSNDLNEDVNHDKSSDYDEDSSVQRDLGSLIVGGALSAVGLSGTIFNWFNSEVLRSQVSIFTAAMPFDPAVEEAQQLNSNLLAARDKVNGMLRNTMEFSGKTQEWANQIPELPTTPADIEKAKQARSDALKSCRQAQDCAILANNSFSDFNHQATDVWLAIQRRIRGNQDEINGLRQQIDQTRRQMESPGWLDAFGLIAIIGRRVIDSARIDNAVAPMLQRMQVLTTQGALFQHCLQTGQVYQNQSQSWVQLCTQTSENLGSICNTLEGLRLEIRADIDIYKQLATAQWASLTERVSQVRALIGSGQQNSPAADLGSAGDDDLSDGSTLNDQSSVSLMSAVSLAPALHNSLVVQTDNSKSVWGSLGKLNEVYFTNDMVAFWDPKGNKKVSLLDVIGTVRQSYVAMQLLNMTLFNRLTLSLSSRALVPTTQLPARFHRTSSSNTLSRPSPTRPRMQAGPSLSTALWVRTLPAGSEPPNLTSTSSKRPLSRPRAS
jgi:hypothetical protein